MGSSSTLLLDELYETGDDRFFAELLESRADQKLTSLAGRLASDKRPWARALLLRYIDDGCDRPGHRGLVKGLFKRAERAGDDEALAHFLVAFDRLVAHRIVERRRYDYRVGAMVLRRRLARLDTYPFSTPRWGKPTRFSRLTRHYLQRRALRYLRRLARTDEARCRSVGLRALALYRPEQLERPEQLLDAWGLLHLLYGRSPVLRFEGRRCTVRPERQLAELEPAPSLPGLFRGDLEPLLDLLGSAPALVVRRFLIGWLERERGGELAGLEVSRLLPLLTSAHPEVQRFAAERLRGARGLETLPIARWLELVELDEPLAVQLVCERMAALVDPARVTLAQCLALARARLQPVAQLGLAWARQKEVGPADLEQLVALREAECRPVRLEGIGWVVEQLRRAGAPELLRELLDARHADVRAAALPLLREVDRYRDDAGLWAALAESPHADARGFLLRHLEERLGKLPAGSVTRLWATTLLDVHRGSRDKRRALRQLADQVVAQPERAEALLPLLALTLRSVRAPERRAALAAVGRASFEDEGLRAALARLVPELSFEEVAS